MNRPDMGEFPADPATDDVGAVGREIQFEAPQRLAGAFSLLRRPSSRVRQGRPKIAFVGGGFRLPTAPPIRLLVLASIPSSRDREGKNIQPQAENVLNFPFSL